MREIQHNLKTTSQNSATVATLLAKTLPKVASEMALHVLAYNLTRVMNIVGIKPFLAAIRLEERVMASAARPLESLSMARGCARIDAGPDTAKIDSADRVQDHARLLAVIGVRKTFPHGLDPPQTLQRRKQPLAIHSSQKSPGEPGLWFAQTGAISISPRQELFHTRRSDS
ncbi:hypothetical protein ACVME8_002045 [Bradyrhizobium diazoefficiens]